MIARVAVERNAVRRDVGDGVLESAYRVAIGPFDLELCEVAEAGHHFLGQSIGEVRVGRIGGQVVEVQHCHAIRSRNGAARRLAAGRGGAVRTLGGQWRGKSTGGRQSPHET